jgi:hypothetical protein
MRCGRSIFVNCQIQVSAGEGDKSEKMRSIILNEDSIGNCQNQAPTYHYVYLGVDI